MRIHVWGLVAASLLALSACSDKVKVREPTKLGEITNPAVKPQRAWSVSAGSGSGKFYTALRPTLATDGLYLADLKGRVYAFNPETGKRQWSVNTKSRIAAGPTVSGNLVLVGTLEGQVIALKRADGSELWRAQLSSEVLGPPAADGNVVVARSVDGRVFGLSADSGERLWTFDRTVPPLVLRGLSKPLIVGNRVIVGLDNGRIVALGLADGAPQWEQAVSVPAGRTELDRLVDIDGDLAEGPDCIYAASFGGEIACLSESSGNVQWRRNVKTYTSLLLAGDKLLIADESGVVWALDAASGAAAWKQEALLYRKLSPPAFYKGYVVVGDFEGYLHWLDASDGRIVGRSRVGDDPIVAQPAASDDLLYVLNQSGRVEAIRLRTE